MDDTTFLVVLFFMGLLSLNNAVFKGLAKENRIMLGTIGTLSLIGSLLGLFVL